MIKGFKSSEFVVLLIVLLPYIAKQLGVDIDIATDEATRLANSISETAQGGNMPEWAAAAYIAGRNLLKWQRGPDTQAPKNKP